MRKFISEQKTHLASQTLEILENLHLQEYPHLLEKQLQVTSFEVSLAYLEHDYLKCIQHTKKYEKLLENPNDPKLFEVYLLMLKSYSHFSPEEFSHTFEKLIKLIEFNYGSSDSVFISVYSITAFFYYQIAQKHEHNPVKANPLYLLSFKLLDQAEKLCLRLFGQSSSQYIDILMDSGRLYETKDKGKSQKYLDRARTLIISSHNGQKLGDFLMYQLKTSLTSKQYEQCKKLLNQCEQLIYTERLKLDKEKMIGVMRIKFQLGLVSDGVYLSEQAIQTLWRSERIEEKKEAVGLAGRLAKRLNLIEGIQDRNANTESFQELYDNYGAVNRDAVVNKLLDQLLSTQYSTSYGSQQGLITRLRQILEDERQSYSLTTKNTFSISQLLSLIQ